MKTTDALTVCTKTSISVKTHQQCSVVIKVVVNGSKVELSKVYSSIFDRYMDESVDILLVINAAHVSLLK